MSQEQNSPSRRLYFSNGQNSFISNGAGAGFTAQSTSEYYSIEKFTCINPHGYMAERVCTRRYNFWGISCQDIGFNNKTRGPDLLVGSVQVQVKYCNSAQATLSAFVKNGAWEYMDGTKFMEIEVPSDQFTEIKYRLRKLIQEGKILGLSDPNMADHLIRKGPCSYEKVVRLCQFGSIEGLTYDAKTGLATAALTATMSFCLNVSHCLYDKRDRDDLIQEAALTALRDGAIAGGAHIVATQIARTGLVRGSLKTWAGRVIDIMPKAIRHSLSHTALNRHIYGAAEVAHVSRLIRVNAVVMMALTLAETGRTAASLATNNISMRQAGHDITRNLSALFAGSFGWQAGFALSSLLLPGSTVIATIAAFVGSSLVGAVGSMSACQVSSFLLGESDDQKRARLILTASMQVRTESFLFYHPDLVASIVSAINDADLGKAIHAASSPEQQYEVVLTAARSFVAQWEHNDAFEPMDAALTGLKTACYIGDSCLLEVAQSVSNESCRARIAKAKDQTAEAFVCCQEALMTLPDSAVFDFLHRALVHLQNTHSLSDQAVTALGQAMVTPQKRAEIMERGGNEQAAHRVGEIVLAVWNSD